MSKAIVVTSGGMDSISMGLKMKHDGHDIHLLHIDLKQKSEGPEHKAVKKIAMILNVPHTFIDCSWLGGLGGSALTDDKIPIPKGMDSMRESLGITDWGEPGLWTPARNVVLLACAAALAESTGAEYITWGANQSETAYPDNTMEFANEFSDMLELGCLRAPSVMAPLYDYDKVEILKWGYDNRYTDIYRHTWSCDDGHHIPCGECGCCCNRRLAFFILGEKYGEDKYPDAQEYVNPAYFFQTFLPDMREEPEHSDEFWWEKYKPI